MPHKIIISAFLILFTCSFAQVPISMGSGSYASYTPEHEGTTGDRVADYREMYTLPSVDRPLMTTKWWASIVFTPWSSTMWPYPIVLETTEEGTELSQHHGWRIDDESAYMNLHGNLTLGGADFSPKDSRVKDWGDYHVVYRMAQNNSTYIDFTSGHGFPFVWAEVKNVIPELFSEELIEFVDENGNPLTLPIIGDKILVKIDDRYWGVYTPENTVFQESGSRLRIRLPEGENYLAVGNLNSPSDFLRLDEYARAIPRQTQVAWDHVQEDGMVYVDYTAYVESLDGQSSQSLQGLIPTHWKYSQESLTDLSYETPRGTMKMFSGNQFRVAWPFRGFLMAMPEPTDTNGSHPYSPTDMEGMIGEGRLHFGATGNTMTKGGDTYWKSKEVSYWARMLMTAKETGSSSASYIQSVLKKELVDWFTYTPGEEANYFARYVNTGGIMGFNPAYGSTSTFTDLHFHYGYLIWATGILSYYDSQFLEDYEEMIKLVISTYANHQRGHEFNPVFRSFDPWLGHSLAAGTEGNNQESSSEAMNSWTGAYMVAVLSGDDTMAEAMAFGYAAESIAIANYWYDHEGDIWPEAYGAGMVCRVFNNGMDYATFFGINPVYIHGINYLPVNNGSFYWYQMSTERMSGDFEVLVNNLGGAETPLNESVGWWDPIYLWVSLWDPEYAVMRRHTYLEVTEPYVSSLYYNVGRAAFSYHFLHSIRSLGFFQKEYYTVPPTGGVFKHQMSGEFKYVLNNPGDEARDIYVYKNGLPIGYQRLEAGEQRVVNELKKVGNSIDADNATDTNSTLPEELAVIENRVTSTESPIINISVQAEQVSEGNTIFFTLYNKQGRKIDEREISVANELSMLSIDTSNYSSGLYYLKISYEGKNYFSPISVGK